MIMGYKLTLTIWILLIFLALTIIINADVDNMIIPDIKNPEKITIKTALNQELTTIELLENTETCYSECWAIWNVTVYSDTEDFLNKMEFEDVFNRKRDIDYKFEVVTGYKAIEIEDYERVCEISISGNQTYYCWNNVTGNHTEYEEIWEDFNPQQKLLGNYLIKLTGYKKPYEDIDWQPTIFNTNLKETWAWWHPSGDTNLRDYYKLNELFSLGNGAEDLGLNAKHLNTSDTIEVIEGKLNSGFNLENGDVISDVNGGDYPLNPSAKGFTIAFWINASSNPSLQTIAGSIDTWIGNYAWVVWKRAEENVSFIGEYSGVGTYCVVTSLTLINDSAWHYVVFTYDETASTNNLKVYVDNVNEATSDCPANSGFTGEATAPFTIGTQGSQAGFIGQLDDFSLWNITWSSTDVETGWNSGVGIELDSPTSFDIFIEHPLNTSYGIIDTDLNFNLTATNGAFSTCNFSLDEWATSTELGSFNTTLYYYVNTSMIDGQYTVNFWCNNSAGFINNTENVTFIIDLESPNLTALNPPASISSPSDINLTIIAGDNYALSYCNFSVTRGASDEITTTEITNCLNTSFTVSGEATYVLHLEVNDTSNNINRSDVTFVYIAPGVIPSGGGGGGKITLEEKEGAVYFSCNNFRDYFTESWAILREEGFNFNTFKRLWYAFWEFNLCVQSSSIVPFPNIPLTDEQVKKLQI